MDFPKLRAAGVTKLIDIVNIGTTKFKTYEEIKYDYGNDIGTFLEYNALISAIPRQWIQEIKNSNVNYIQYQLQEHAIFLIDKVDSKMKTSKLVYNIMITRLDKEDGGRIIWNKKLGTEISKDEWEQIRKDSYYVTIATKLHYFQMCLLSNKIITKSRRVKWKKINPMCVWCQNGEETTLHILWECNCVKKFWKCFTKWCNYAFKAEIELTAAMVILNNYKGLQKKLIQMMLLMAKQYIYACTCLNKEIQFTIFLQKVMDIYYAELQIAVSNHVQHKHSKKWFQYVKFYDI